MNGSFEEASRFTEELEGQPAADPRVRGGRFDKCAFHEYNDNEQYICLAAVNSHQYRSIL